jgi:hypothetical protein
MNKNQSGTLAFCLLLIAVDLSAQEVDTPVQQVTIATMRDPQWMSYRDAYKALRWHDDYKKDKNFVRLTFDLKPKDRQASLKDLRLELIGKTTRMELPLDEGLTTSIPDIKQAYEEDAEFRLNRQAGTFDFQYTGSIRLNPNGVYPLADLHQACDQLLNYLRDARLSFRLKTAGKKCIAVKFHYPERIAKPRLFYKNESGEMVAISLMKPLEKIPGNAVAFRFPEQQKNGEIIAEDLPLSIHVIYD